MGDPGGGASEAVAGAAGPAPAFELSGVVKRYGEVVALDGVDLRAPAGEIFALLGPNGAGKTTIVRLLSTLIRPDVGTVSVDGLDVATESRRVRRLIGLAGQFAAVDEFQTGLENLVMVGELYGLGRAEARSRARDVLRRLDLVAAGSRTVRTYSGGMRRKLDLGASLVGRPRILFLDEPTTGLDPRSRNDAWQLVRELVAGGTSILLTTQYLDEADELADTIAVVDRGRTVAVGSSEDLKSALGGDVVEVELVSPQDRERTVSAVAPFAVAPPTYDEQTRTVSVPVRSGAGDATAVVVALHDHHLDVRRLSLHRPSLDDVFLTLTGGRR